MCAKSRDSRQNLGLTPRPAIPSDYDSYARLTVELGTGDPIPNRERWLASAMPRSTFYELKGDLIGYCTVDVMGAIAYVRSIVVTPEARRQGLGRAMMNERRTTLRQSGCASWRLNVKPDNVAAIRLYESM